MPIKVVIVDDHGLLVDALTEALAEHGDLDVVGTAATLSEALPLVIGHQPDVALLDYRLADTDGTTATQAILEACEDCRVLMMSAAEPAAMLADAIDAGIAGFVHKSRDLQDLVEAVRTVADGGAVFEPRDLQTALGQLSRRKRHGPLTDRELEVLQLLTQGLTTDRIAERLTLSHHTVRNHVRHVLSKLDVHSQLEAVAVGLREGLVAPPAPED